MQLTVGGNNGLRSFADQSHGSAKHNLQLKAA